MRLRHKLPRENLKQSSQQLEHITPAVWGEIFTGSGSHYENIKIIPNNYHTQHLRKDYHAGDKITR